MNRIPRWRIALVASALVLLGAVGAGLVFAATPAAPAAEPATADLGALLGADSGPGDAAAPGAARLGRRAGRLLGRLERIVHVEATVDLPQKGIVTFAVDHGTISAIGGGTVVVKEKDGRTATLKTTDETHVRKGGEPARLADLKVGDEVFVMSRLEGGSFVAYRIGVPAAQPATTD